MPLSPEELKPVREEKIDGGSQRVYQHFSKACSCDMRFHVFLPDREAPDETFRVLFFLSGLQHTEQSFINLTEYQKHAVQHRFIVVCPDTSPRLDVPGDSERFWVGRAASWYIDATQEPFARNYQMYSYVAQELYELVLKHFPVASPAFGMCGYSMGGCGAMCIGLRNPDKFHSLSTFAPNCNPMSWGDETMFPVFLGTKREAWKLFDPTEVAKAYQGPKREILVDQGTDDDFYRRSKTLNPERLLAAAEKATDAEGNSNLSINLRLHPGFDHSHAIVKTFWADHFAHHSRHLSGEHETSTENI